MFWLSGTFGARATMAMLGETLPGLKPIPDDIDEQERSKLRSARAKESAMAI